MVVSSSSKKKKMSHSQMDTKFRVSKPRFFSLKKWTLLTVLVINCLFLLLLLLMRAEVIRKVMDYLREQIQLKEEAVKQLQVRGIRAVHLSGMGL